MHKRREVSIRIYGGGRPTQRPGAAHAPNIVGVTT